MNMRWFGFSLGVALALAAPLAALAQSALVPNAKQTFVDSNGAPLVAGKVYMYTPNSTNPKATWIDQNEAVQNSFPVTLDSAGRAVIFGQGNYRQIVRDASGNLVWDSFTSASGAAIPSGGTAVDTAPVGAVMAYAGFSIPANWALADGSFSQYNRTTYADLLDAITFYAASGTCTSGSPNIGGFADTSQIPVGARVEASCVTNPTNVVARVNATTIQVSTNATATATTPVRVFPWGNGDGVNNFNVPDLRGVVIAGADAMGGTAASRLTSTYFGGNSAATPAVLGGLQSGTASTTVAQANLPNVSFAISGITLSDPGHTHGYTSPLVGSNQFMAGGDGTARQNPTANGGTTQSATTGITVSAQGSAASGGSGTAAVSAAFSNVQPTYTMNYIIKVLPTGSGAGGVISVGGMFGDLICGTYVTCANQTIDFTGAFAISNGVSFTSHGGVPITAPSIGSVASLLVLAEDTDGIQFNNHGNSAAMGSLSDRCTIDGTASQICLAIDARSSPSGTAQSTLDVGTHGSAFLSIVATGHGRAVQVTDGNESGTAVTTVTPTMHISRYEEIPDLTTLGLGNAALLVESLATNTSSMQNPNSQANAIAGIVQQNGTGDAAAVTGSATGNSPSTTISFAGYGGFFIASAGVQGDPPATAPLAGAVGAGATVGNNTGRDQSYALFKAGAGASSPFPAIPVGVGTFGIQVAGGGANLNTVAVWLQPNSPAAPDNRFDYGFVVEPDSVKSVAYASPGYFVDISGNITALSYTSLGSVPGISGCSAGTQTGGPIAGTFTSGTTGACTVVLTFGRAATTGWACAPSNRTTANLIRQSASSTTTATITGTTNSGDVISFVCMAY